MFGNSYQQCQGQDYKLLENQNISTKDCRAGDNKYPEERDFVQEKDCEIYMKVGKGIELLHIISIIVTKTLGRRQNCSII